MAWRTCALFFMILTSLGVESAHWPFWMGLMKRFRNSPSEPSRFFLMKLTMQWSVRIKFAVSIWEGSIPNQIKFTPACQNCFSFSIQKKEELYTGDGSLRKDWRMKEKHVFFGFVLDFFPPELVPLNIPSAAMLQTLKGHNQSKV